MSFKVLHLNTFDNGGAAIAAKRLHMALLKNGVDSSMLFSGETDASIPKSYGLQPTKQTGFNSLANRISRKMGGARTYWETSTAILGGRAQHHDLFSLPYADIDVTQSDLFKKADILHLHWVPSLLDYQFFSTCNKLVVWTLHDMNPFTGGCHYSAGCNHYQDVCAVCPQLQGTKNTDMAQSFMAYKKQQLKTKSLYLVTLCEWMDSKVKQSSLMGAFMTTKIYNSLDVALFKPVDQLYAREVLNIPKDAKVVLFVSERVENYRKGFDLLTEAIQDFGQDMLFCSIGIPGKTNEASSNIKHLGKLTNAYALVLAYNAADVLVIPSREDNLPNVMLEALCCGTPVIAFNNGGMQEIVQNGVNGILVAEQDSQKLAEAIETFFQSISNFNKTAISAHAGQLFAPNKQAEAHIQLYTRLLSSH